MLPPAAFRKGVAMRLVRALVVTSLVAVVLALGAAPAGAQSIPTLVAVRAGGGWGIGLDRRRPLEVSTLSGPSRLVIDIDTSGPSGSTGTLPFTGAASQELLVTALALLATGTTVLALARRTRSP